VTIQAKDRKPITNIGKVLKEVRRAELSLALTQRGEQIKCLNE
jgi:hypothetical protein